MEAPLKCIVRLMVAFTGLAAVHTAFLAVPQRSGAPMSHSLAAPHGSSMPTGAAARHPEVIQAPTEGSRFGTASTLVMGFLLGGAAAASQAGLRAKTVQHAAKKQGKGSGKGSGSGKGKGAAPAAKASAKPPAASGEASGDDEKPPPAPKAPKKPDGNDVRSLLLGL